MFVIDAQRPIGDDETFKSLEVHTINNRTMSGHCALPVSAVIKDVECGE